MPDTAAHTTKEIITKALSQEELDMLQYYMTSGVYGTFDRRIENNVKKYSKNGVKASLCDKTYFSGHGDISVLSVFLQA